MSDSQKLLKHLISPIPNQINDVKLNSAAKTEINWKLFLEFWPRVRYWLLTKGLILCIKSPTEDTKCNVYKNNKFIDYFCLAINEIKCFAELFSFIVIKYKKNPKNIFFREPGSKSSDTCEKFPHLSGLSLCVSLCVTTIWYFLWQHPVNITESLLEKSMYLSLGVLPWPCNH